MKQILSITRKELAGYFGSPLALIFMGTFLAAVLFVFFTVEKFFARNIADIRPLFEWMPILLIFLLAALTMRQWSEEQRSGTMEVLLTLPVNLFQLVVGKFLAVMAIIGLSLALTLFLPVTAASLGNLDWGPVFGGYLAAILMASAYAAIGLFVSSRTDNQIVALISTVLLGGLFYVIGTRGVTDFFGGSISQIFWAIGTGSRFESIERGVIDLRDLIYYLSLTGIFLAMNVLSLDSLRWSIHQKAYRTKYLLTNGLLILNLILVNVWVYPLQGLRLDLTEQKEYTLSQVSEDLIVSLQEPLLIRAYLSEQTHPLLTPLLPRISDMLREYEIASNGKIIAEVLDPLSDPEIEAEANQSYGINPTPFQISGRHEASVINSYFDILVRYGDQSIVLNFQDLIEVKQYSNSIEVGLRNLEYDLTSAIKKVVYGFQSIESVLAALDDPVTLTLLITPDTLPSQYAGAQEMITQLASKIQDSSNGKFVFDIINPDDANAPVTRQQLVESMGIQPIPTALFSSDSYYFHMLLVNGEKSELLYPPAELAEAEIQKAIETSLKRTSSGFLKTVGLWTPPEIPTQDMFGQMQQPLSTYQMLRETLQQDYTVETLDLSTGQISSNIDAAVIIAPQNLGEKEMYAIDQYLMRGGAVIVSASPYKVGIDQFQGTLILEPVSGNLSELLENYGVSLSSSLVMDLQNEPFPIAVNRDVNGFQVQEIQAVNYPFFVDVRPEQMDAKSPITANLAAITTNWASAIELDAEKTAAMDATTLLTSSAQAWTTEDTNIQPNFDQYPEHGFAIAQENQPSKLAVSLQGSFESYFKEKASPLQAVAEESSAELAPEQGPPSPEASAAFSTVDSSPDSAQLVVVGSSTFADDFVLQLSSRLYQDRFMNSLTFIKNAVDWSVEDLDLLAIRSRGSVTRVLIPLDDRVKTFWEVLNYVIALVALLGIYIFWQVRKRGEQPIKLLPITVEEGN